MPSDHCDITVAVVNGHEKAIVFVTKSVTLIFDTNFYGHSKSYFYCKINHFLELIQRHFADPFEAITS